MRIGGIAALLLVGCQQPTQQTTDDGGSRQSIEIGRYVIVHSPHIQRDTVLLDTATGRTWQQVTFTDLEEEPTAWTPMARSNNTQEMTDLRFIHPPKKDKGGGEPTTSTSSPPEGENAQVEEASQDAE